MKKTCYACGGTKIANRTGDSEFSFRIDKGIYRSNCKECVNKKAKRRRDGYSNRGVDYLILWCPRLEYPKMHHFSSGEFIATLEQGYMTPGMIVGCNDKRYVVCVDGRSSLRIKKMGYPEDVKFPEQWLTEVNGRARV